MDRTAATAVAVPVPDLRMRVSRELASVSPNVPARSVVWMAVAVTVAYAPDYRMRASPVLASANQRARARPVAPTVARVSVAFVTTVSGAPTTVVSMGPVQPTLEAQVALLAASVLKKGLQTRTMPVSSAAKMILRKNGRC